MLRSMPRPTAIALTTALALGLSAACSQLDAHVGGTPPDAQPGATTYREVLDVEPDRIDALDVLFVIDDSGSMRDKQAELMASAQEALFGLLDQVMGERPDLHVAVVSTDMGAGANNIQFCPPLGDDGTFRTGGPNGCAMVDGTFLADVANPDGTRQTNYTGDISDAFACMANLGTQGCGLEMPLASARRALDGSNPDDAGFLRPDAMLLVVFVTDEDDCSTDEMAMFDPNANLGPIDHRCFTYGVVCDPDTPLEAGEKTACAPREDSAYMHPVGDYAAFFRALKPDPSKVMLGGIFAPTTPVVVSLDNPSQPGELGLLPSCQSQSGTIAKPAVRLGAIVDAFPARYAFSSICDLTASEELTRVTRTTAGVMTREPCLLGPVPAAPTCRAFRRSSFGQTSVPMCGTGGGSTCVEIEPDAATCGYASGLAARVVGDPLPAGEHLVVECQVPDAP
jgi:hypothetical protein